MERMERRVFGEVVVVDVRVEESVGAGTSMEPSSCGTC